MENSAYKQWTLAFFDYVSETEEKLIESISSIKLDKPIIIATSNGNPVKYYGLKLIGKQEINYVNAIDYKKEIDSLGLYKKRSTDFDHLLKAFFGIMPWDGYYKDHYIDEWLVKGTKKRKDVRYLKDFTLEELKRILPSNSIKLKQEIEKRK